jgi:hypothetical protein
LKVLWVAAVILATVLRPDVAAAGALQFAIGGWIALSVTQLLIGWIVRGFAALPPGQNS